MNINQSNFRSMLTHVTIIKHLKLVILSSICCVFFSLNSFAQVDTTYYKKILKHDLIIRTSLYHNILNLRVDRLKHQESITYFSNNRINLGIGVSHPRIPFEISVGFAVGNRLNEKHSKSKSLDLQIHRYGRKYVLDVFFQKYKSFYIEDSGLTLTKSNFPNLSISVAGIVGQYIFNGERFSCQAAYNQKEIQIKSTGSFLLGGGIYFFDLESEDSPIIGDNHRVKSYQLGLNTGYSYNWKINNKWLLNGSFTMGANFHNDNSNTTFFNSKLSVKPTALVRISSFYNSPNWSVGISGVVNIVALAYTENLKCDLDFGRFSFTYLRRINIKKKGLRLKRSKRH